MELRNVVLVGGGHSNVQVLKIIATELKKADRVKLILVSGQKRSRGDFYNPLSRDLDKLIYLIIYK